VTRPRLSLIVIVAGVIAGFYALDVSLEQAQTSELHSEAQGLYEQGTKLLASGRASDALDRLQRAFSIDRKNRHYQLGYAEALIAAGRNEDATALLNDVVRQSPNDGQANLLLARLARSRKDLADAAANYHRAIYGVWDRDAVAHANVARLEWIRELAARGDQKQLLGELLPLEAETQDPAVLKQVAQYLLVAGSPTRSADLYRTLLAAHPDDVALLKGLGQADAAAGEYASAQRAYLRAFRLAPGDLSIRHDMELVSTLSGLDPTPRNLSSREKYHRSLRILTLVRDSLVACGSQSNDLAEAGKILGLKNPDVSNEAAEQLLQLAESLWHARSASCTSPEVLPVLMQKLAQKA
jgi:cytochrome c-type biogenesis protein CcmH/NrfG